MQRYTMYPANPQPSDLFRRMVVENAGSATHGSSDLLLQRMLDAAASQRPPIGLFDPREFGQTQTLHPALSEPSSDVFALGPNAPSSRDSGEAFVQRIFDEAVSKRAPMGLFDSQEFGLPHAQTPADFRAKSRLAPDGDLVAKPSASDEMVLRLLDEAVGKQQITDLFDSLDTRRLQPPLDIQAAFPSANDARFGDGRGGPDAPIQRVLDDTAANRPPLNEVDPRGLMPWPTTYNATSNVPSADRPSGMISLIPPIAPPPWLQLGLFGWQNAAPVFRATGFDSPIDPHLAANALGRAAYVKIFAAH